MTIVILKYKLTPIFLIKLENLKHYFIALLSPTRCVTLLVQLGILHLSKQAQEFGLKLHINPFLPRFFVIIILIKTISLTTLLP